jgi:hypothetical protein
MSPRMPLPRSDSTFKQNRLQGRCGWLRPTPAYFVGPFDRILDATRGGRNPTRERPTTL